MPSDHNDAPPPDLRIVNTDSLQPHEEHDSQRAQPLIERLQREQIFINPPIVAQITSGHYVILDGSNRYYAFSHLGYAHILVQVVSYDSGHVELKTWRHIIAHWQREDFMRQLQALSQVELAEGLQNDAVAHILFRDGQVTAVCSPVANTHERNAVLRQVVSVYQRQATLYRTALGEPDEIWPLYPDAIAVVVFPAYQPGDILAAARYRAYLPPGISRHIIHGRALRVNYSLDKLRDPTRHLDAKNEELRAWVRQKLAKRQVRYYAEATYQFDE